ncbi:MAG: DUF1638 domain-containing protein [Anaerolineaceae bacterium]|nr:DUF1638 domain-containing protein [Anaerolineaceae bacterium]
MDNTHTLVMACATVIEEMMPYLPEGMQHQVFEFGLHVNPDKLRETLQEAIDAVSGQYETIILGYGLCSQAIVGIKANGCRLVVPRVDDCIAIFLGSRNAYNDQTQSEPGTYYLTKGWIEVGDTPFSEYDHLAEKYGKEKADRIFKIMMGNYKRLALINTGQYEVEKYREYAGRTAEKFGLRYEEIEGSNTLVKQMLLGPWDDDVVVLEPGETFVLQQFFRPGEITP